MPNKTVQVTIKFKKRTGIKLLLALFRTIPAHYHILRRRHNSHLLALYAALRLSFAGYDFSRAFRRLR